MEEFLGIVFGAVISALIGLLSVYLTERVRRQTWKRDNIYAPLYNEINELLTTKRYLLEQLSTKWRAFDYYSKLMVDEKLREALTAYEKMIAEFNRLSEEFTKASEKSLDALVEAVKRALKPFISEDNKSIVVEWDDHSHPSSYIEVKQWVRMFVEPLLARKTGRALYAGLVEYSEARRQGHEKFFRKWFAETPGIFDDLVSECSGAIGSTQLEAIYKQVKRKRDEIIKHATELRKKLEKKIT